MPIQWNRIKCDLTVLVAQAGLFIYTHWTNSQVYIYNNLQSACMLPEVNCISCRFVQASTTILYNIIDLQGPAYPGSLYMKHWRIYCMHRLQLAVCGGGGIYIVW